ncbi:MAG: phosphatidate cytidylyltransferase [Actinomycetes bacterium]
MDILPSGGRRRERSRAGSASAAPAASATAVATSRRAARASSGRAGRNLPVAVAVGVGLGALVVLTLFTRKELFVALTSVAIVLAVWELSNAFAARRLSVPIVPVVVGSVGILVSAYASGQEALLVAFGLTVAALVVWRVLDGVDGAVRDVAAGVFSTAYVPFLAGFAMLMLAADDGHLRIVVFILVTVASDVGGYAAGVAFGRHPMAPSVSPKKSWEGLAGSAVACLLAGALSVVLLLDGTWWAGLVVGAAAVVTAAGGDLSESLLKRDLGIKDMGSLLPGHGGVMDRLDSLLPTAPVVYLLLAALVPAAS